MIHKTEYSYLVVKVEDFTNEGLTYVNPDFGSV